MSKLKLVLLLLLCVLTYSIFQIGGFFAVLGVAVSFYTFHQLITQEERWIPIGEIALAMAAFQWIISPLITYTIPNPMFKMSQDCSTYMMYTVPMYCCFVYGYEKFKRPFTFTIDEMQEKCLSAEYLAKTFIVIGLLTSVMPAVTLIAQIVKYLSQLMYIGFIMLMIAKPQRATLYFVTPVIITLLYSIRGVMFHELMTWGLMLLLIWLKIKRFGIIRKIVVIALCLVCVNTIQTIKFAYRQSAWHGGGANVSMFVNLMINNVSSSATSNEQGYDNNSRYNQGWIISMIYNHVPNKHDYFYGRTYKDAVIAALLPRFLVPNKKGAGQQVQSDFREMTGHPLKKNTSMGLSVLGESYGNFGLLGGAVFMFLWGVFIARIMSWVNNWAYNKSFLWILLLPIIGFVLVEAEISMITVLNWTIKGLIFSFIIIYYCRRKGVI